MIEHITPRKHRMTPYQKITAKQKEKRLNKINRYYKANPGCTMKNAITFIPESAVMVSQYSKLLTALVIEGDQDEITAKDLHEYVYGEEPLKYRQRK